jgi:thymidylate synthase (FAD)
MVQDNVDTYAKDIYEQALEKGIAKEVARAVLPEGLTPTRMYMSGTIRSWMHYCQLRSGNGTQKEHQEIAKQISDTLATQLPESWKALMGE